MISFYSYQIFLIFQFPEEKIIKTTSIKRVPKLFFGFVTVEKGKERRSANYNFWIKNILKYGHDYVYCTQNRIEPEFNWIPVKNWTKYYPEKYNVNFQTNRDRENKRVTMCDYFLHTDADFFINPTDDVLFDDSRVNEFARILASQYDTEKDLVIKGNCMFNILHGGSGYIFTRAMARKFVNLSDRWLRESMGPDDVEMNKFLRYMKLTIIDGASPYFSGRSFSHLESKIVNISKFKKCNETWFDDRCKQKVYKLEDVYLMHPSGFNVWHNIHIWKNFLQLVHNSSHHFGWYSTSDITHEICRFD